MALWLSQGEEQNVSLWPLMPCVDRPQLRSPASLSLCSPCFLALGYTMFLSFLECTRLLAPSHGRSQCGCFCGSHRLLSCSLPVISHHPLKLTPLATSCRLWFIPLVCAFQVQHASLFSFSTDLKVYVTDSSFINSVSRAPPTTRGRFFEGRNCACFAHHCITECLAYRESLWLFIRGMKYESL